MSLSDHAVLQLLQSQEQSALVLLYDRYSSLVYSVALRILRNSTLAEDVTQELFLQIWSRPEQIQVRGATLHGWMITASRNRSIDILRSKRPESLGDLVLASPSNLGRSTEHRLICEAGLALLGRDQRVLIEMSFLDEMTHAEIALATGLPLGTVKSRIRRTVIELRTRLSAAAFERVTDVTCRRAS